MDRSSEEDDAPDVEAGPKMGPARGVRRFSAAPALGTVAARTVQLVFINQRSQDCPAGVSLKKRLKFPRETAKPHSVVLRTTVEKPGKLHTTFFILSTLPHTAIVHRNKCVWSVNVRQAPA